MSDTSNGVHLWRIRDRYTLREAAILWAGLNPHGRIESNAVFKVIEDELRKAVETREIPAYVTYIQGQYEHEVLGIQPCRFVDEERTWLKKLDLAKWAKDKGMAPEFLEGATDAQPSPERRTADGNKIHLSSPLPSGEVPSTERRSLTSQWSNNPNKTYLSSKEAAERLGIEVETLATWRHTKRYDIPFTKIGGRIRYLEADLLRHLEQRTQRP